jgi:hypothetical protein
LSEDLLHERVADRVEMLEELLYQMLGKKVDRAVISNVILYQVLLIFVLYEVLRITLP